ncbi:MAG: hypothetical protein AB7O97_20045 [Planctomycetota bacterium]
MNLRLLLTPVLGGLMAVGLGAQSLSGTFVDPIGNPVGNVAVILSGGGGATGTSLPNGTFAIGGLRDRVYTVQIDPHNDTLAPQQFDLQINGNTSLGTVVLQPGAAISGVALGANGAPLFGANMNAYLLDGTKLFTPRDGTDALGNFLITVPVDTDVRFVAIPPVGTTLVPYTQFFNLPAPIDIGTIELPQGYSVSGNVVDEINLLPISGCEIVTTNMLTGEEVTQRNKLTNTLGAFSVLLPFGLYQIDILPPLLNLHEAKQVFGLAVTTFGHNLGLQRLKRTVILQGLVTGPGGPVVGADIDVYTADGYKLFTPNDNTNAAGQFAVLVPAGQTYTVRVDPQPTSGLVGTFSNPVVVNGNTNAGLISLQSGVAATLAVVDVNGQPVANASVDLRDPSTGKKIVVPGNHAGADGIIHATVPFGTWDIEVRGEQGSLVKPLVAPSVPVGGPISLPVVLQPKTVYTDFDTLGILTTPNGGETFVVWKFGNASTQSQPAVLDTFVELPDGTEVPFVPSIPATFPPQSELTLVLWTPTPLLPANQLNRIQRYVVRWRNPANNQVLDQAYVDYFPVN